MYFEVQGMGLYSRMKIPVIIRSCGMMLLYALTTVYATQRLPLRYFSTWICIMLTVRMVVGPVTGAAAYTNALQERQQNYITRFAQHVDAVNQEASQAYRRTYMGMKYQGKNEQEAQHMAALSTKGKLQMQAMILTVKDLAGWTVWGCLGAILLTLLLPYRKRDISRDRERGLIPPDPF